MSLKNLSLETQELLGRLWEESSSAEEKERLQFARDALRFIQVTGQTHELEDYRAHLDVDAPPLVIAAFDTREEADRWLQTHPSPPHHANILISGEYHYVTCSRQYNDRAILSSNTLEYYLAEMVREGTPPPALTFSTREEADRWLHGQSEPPRQVFIQVAGEPYLAAYHEKIHLRALYPLSRAAKNVHWD